MSRTSRDTATSLAYAFWTGTWHMRALMARGDEALDAGGMWLREVAFAVVQRWPHERPAHLEALIAFITTHKAFLDAWKAREIPHVVPGVSPVPRKMGPARWPVKPLHSLGDVLAWLCVGPSELAWFADPRGLERLVLAEPLRHYRRGWVDRGERLPRLLEAPKDRLKAIQRRILTDILEAIPAHDAAHGFVRGRSVLTHAKLHAGQALVVRFDLEAYFTNVATWRALGVFRAMGYSASIAEVLLGLCTTRTPESVLRAAPRPDDLQTQRFVLQRRLAEWHLPQGAPTSPVLANLAPWQLDVRLSALAKKCGLVYSRYADDLVFSSATGFPVGALTQFVDDIVRDEGFRLNVHKTRVMRAHTQQRVTGLVVNQKPNIARADFDALKALLHRCKRKGPLSQATGELAEFRATLQGRIAWVSQVSSSRGAKLQKAFDALSW